MLEKSRIVGLSCPKCRSSESVSIWGDMLDQVRCGAPGRELELFQPAWSRTHGSTPGALVKATCKLCGNAASIRVT